jgi:hypothetical protein
MLGAVAETGERFVLLDVTIRRVNVVYEETETPMRPTLKLESRGFIVKY